MDLENLYTLAEEIQKLLIKHKLKITTAESCTGGMLAQIITSISGSSKIFEYGFVTYSNKAKSEILGVNKDDLKKYGAVSDEIVYQMAEGALKRSGADIALSVSGIAGPSGGSIKKPVGLVYFGMAHRKVTNQYENVLTQHIQTFKQILSGSRMDVRVASCHFILSKLYSFL